MDHQQVYLTYGEWAEEIVRGAAISEPHIPTKALSHPTKFSDTSSLFSLDPAYSRLHPAAAEGAVQCVLHTGQSSHRRWQESGTTVPVFHSLCPAVLSLAPHPTCWTATQALALSWLLSTAADSSGNGPVVLWMVGGSMGWETPAACKAQPKRNHRASVGLTAHTKCQPPLSAEGSQERTKVWANTVAPLAFGQAEVAQVSLGSFTSILCFRLGQPFALDRLLRKCHELHVKCTRHMGVNITVFSQIRGPIQGCLPNCWMNLVTPEEYKFLGRGGELDKDDQGHTPPLIPNVVGNSKGFRQEERCIWWNKTSIFTVLIRTMDVTRSWKALTLLHTGVLLKQPWQETITL